MKKLIRYILPAVVIGATMGSCTKMKDVGILSTGNFSDTTGPLKAAASFPIGFAVPNNLFLNNAAYRNVVVNEASSITFENEFKYGSVVQNNGSYNFNTTDAMVNAATAAGLQIYGHVLGWHSQQNGTYLKNFAGIVVPTAAELITNGGFESGLSGWSTFNAANGATISATNVASEVRSGTGAMKVVNPVANAGQQFRVQVSSSAFATTPGRQYSISYWVKAASAGGSIRLSTGPTAAQYQGDQTIGTAYQLVSWTITASLSSTTFLFDMGQAANTYFIDDVSVKEVVAAPSGVQIAAKLDVALNDWITTAVTRYKGKIQSWDVINELFADDGSIRNNSNTNTTDNNVVVWSHYMGRDFGLKAFNYAKAADPNALLFINDYGLETSARKLDSLIAYVAEIKAKGAKVDGIGTQMHIDRNTSYGGIDNMMKKLAATGLLVRITELDVKTVLASASRALTPELEGYQAATYNYVIGSYLTNIPKAQQAGITIWGVHDASSWLSNSGREFPLLFNNDFSKKRAYAAVLQALKAGR
jgi:endo-1,4-beta-xylanase